MNSIVLVEVRRGRDGRLYPARPLTDQERTRARGLVHGLRCRDGLSVRAVQRALAGRYGIRRSTGTIARDLSLFTCSLCRRDSTTAPDP